MDHRLSDEALCTSSDIEFIVSELGGSTTPFLESSLNASNQHNQTFVPNQINPIVPNSIVQTFVPVEDEGSLNNATQPNLPGITISQSPTGQIPSRDNFPGVLDFEVLLDNYSCTSNKRTWVYSMPLHKVFIDMNKTLLLQFRMSGNFNSAGLWVRALPVFSSDDLVNIPVTRCGIHELPDDTLRKAHAGGICNCANFKLTRHVVQSTHSHAQYDYNPESDRHSVLVPMANPQPGADAVSVGYFFTCKTSCSSIRGMNRKPIDVIFTLETDQSEVLGRYILPVKICSCPKRDKEKEEAASLIKDGIPAGKRRMSASEREVPDEKKIKKELDAPKNPERRESNSQPPTPNDQTTQQIGGIIEDIVTRQEEILTKQAELAAKVEEIARQVEQANAANAKQFEQLNNRIQAFMQFFCQNFQPTMKIE